MSPHQSNPLENMAKNYPHILKTKDKYVILQVNKDVKPWKEDYKNWRK